MKILMIRMDRLGDLICTLPVDQHPALMGADHRQVSTHWLITRGLEPILDCALPSRKYWSATLKFSWRNFVSLLKQLRKEQYDKVILFYAPWWVAFACQLAGIPQRYSPRSRWFQILFFNHTLTQKRSRSEKHEAEYNWDLVHWALTHHSLKPTEMPPLKLESITPIPSQLPVHYVVIHPGMGGSALNWPTSHYLKLIEKLIGLGKQVVITGTPSDQPWLRELEAPLKSHPQVSWLVGQLDLKALIAVLSKSDAVIAPSTGVVHIAASTGVKTLGIYSPILVQSPQRWRPRGPQARALVPEVRCPARIRCLEENCPDFPCLAKLTPEHLIEQITEPSLTEDFKKRDI